jgi:hypothetical protein
MRYPNCTYCLQPTTTAVILYTASLLPRASPKTLSSSLRVEFLSNSTLEEIVDSLLDAINLRKGQSERKIVQSYIIELEVGM